MLTGDEGELVILLRRPAESDGAGCNPGLSKGPEGWFHVLGSNLLVDFCPLVLKHLTHLLHALLRRSVQQQGSQQHAAG